MILSFFYFSNKKVKKKFLIICLIAIPLVIQGLVFTNSAVFDRVFKSTSELNIDSIGRGDLWRMAWGYFIENPWFGGHIELIDVPNYKGYLPGNIYPHNMILEVFMSSGTLVGLLFVFLIIFNFSQLFAALKKNPKEIWIIILLIVGFVQHFFSGAIYGAIMFFFPLGLLSSFITHIKK
jgi:O-antigen ligase